MNTTYKKISLEKWSQINHFEYLVEEWSINNKYKPSDVSAFSKEKAIWKCKKCDQEYEANINNRSRGSGCPVCTNKKIISGINDFETWCKNNKRETLLREWSSETPRPNQVSPMSGIEIEWMCEVEHHKWKTPICKRTSNNNNCPICANKKILPGFNDFETWCKKNNKEYLLDEWDENNKINPSDIAPMSMKRVIWKCKEYGHIYEMPLSRRTSNKQGCPICDGKKIVAGFNDFETWCKKNNKEYLLDEWDESNTLLPSSVAPMSTKKVTWKCKKCKQKWVTTIASRTHSKNGCPICYNRKIVPGINDFETWCKKNKMNYLLDEWSSNNAVNPNELAVTSRRKIIWLCKKCKNEYGAQLVNRTSKRSGCPICSSSKILPGVNDFWTWCKYNDHEYLLQEWSSRNTINPKTIAKRHSGKAKWICRFCGNEFEAKVSNRTSNDTGCPICANRLAIPGFNDFETWCIKNNYQHLLSEWHKENSSKPCEVTSGFTKKVKWKCNECGYEWKVSPYLRTQNVGCPACARRIVVKGCNDFETWCIKNHKEYFINEWDSELNEILGISPKKISYKYAFPVWWKCSLCGNKYTSTIANRKLKIKREQGLCPYCSGIIKNVTHYL